MAISKKPSKKSRHYLLTGDIDLEKYKLEKKVAIIGPVSVVPDQLLYAPVPGAADKKVVPWKSDNHGVFSIDKNQFSTTQPAHLNVVQEFVVPPLDMLNLSWAVDYLQSSNGPKELYDPDKKKDNWHKAISDFINSGNFDIAKSSAQLTILDVKFTNMRKPKPKPSANDIKPDLDVDYRAWYKQHKATDVISGYFIPRIRMIFCIINNPLLIGAEINLFNAKGGRIAQATVKEVVGSSTNKDKAGIAAIFANASALPRGEIYRFEVDARNIVSQIDTSKEKWCSSILNEYKYELQEILNFRSRNINGDFDIVICDPITIEETLIQQFPKEYEHVALFAKGVSTPNNKIVHAFRGREELLFDSYSLDSFVGQLKWIHAKAGFAQGILESDSCYDIAEKIGLAMLDQAKDFMPEEGKKGADAIGLLFKTKEAIEAWQKFPKSIAANILERAKTGVIKEVKVFSPQAAGSIIKEMEFYGDDIGKTEYRLFKLFNKDAPDFIGKKYINTAEDAVDLAADFKPRDDFITRLTNWCKDEYPDIEKSPKPAVLGKTAKAYADQLDKYLKRLGWILSCYTFSNSWYELWAKKDVLDDTLLQYKLLLMDYMKDTPNDYQQLKLEEWKDKKDQIKTNGIDLSKAIPSRDGITNLEKFRASTVMSGRNVDAAIVNAAMETFDMILALGEETKCPPLVLACKIIALIKFSVIVISSVSDFIYTLGITKTSESLIDVMSELRENSSENQDLMPEGEGVESNFGIEDIDVQFRLRAEAFYGLVGLITRASASASEGDAKKIQELVRQIAKCDQEEKDLGSSPDKALLKNITDKREILANELADIREKSLEERVKKYKIKEYIESYIFKDGWKIPIKEFCAVMMDAMHYQNSKGVMANVKDSYGENTRKYDWAKGIGFVLSSIEAPMDHTLEANFAKAFPIHNLSSRSVKDLVRAFRTVQPELLESDPVEYTCIFHRPRGMTDKIAKQKQLKDNGWELVNKENVLKRPHFIDGISALDQIRIFVLLRDDPIFASNVYPFELQLSRTDGSNISGPLYKGIVQSLDPKQLLLHEKKIAGMENGIDKKRFGIVLHPTFQFGALHFPGTKPMDFGWSDRLMDHGYLAYLAADGVIGPNDYLEYCKRHQVVMWEVQIGNTTCHKRPINLGMPDDAETSKIDKFGRIRSSLNNKDDVVEYNISLDDADDKEKKLLDIEFLKTTTRHWQMPKILNNTDWVAGIMMKIGNGDFIFLHQSQNSKFSNLNLTNSYNNKPIKVGLANQKNAAVSMSDDDIGLVIQNYDWKTPMEFIVLIRAGSHIEHNAKHVAEVPITETTNLNWKNSIKLQFNVSHRSDWKGDTAEAEKVDVKGPTYGECLHYLGKYSSTGDRDYKFVSGTVNSSNKGISPDANIDDAFDLISSLCEKAKSGDRDAIELLASLTIDFSDPEVHMFACRVTPEFTTPDGIHVDTIRPFARYDYLPEKGKYPDKEIKAWGGIKNLEASRELFEYNEVAGNGLDLSGVFPFGYYEYHFENFTTSDGTDKDKDQFYQKKLTNYANGGGFGGPTFKIMIEAPDNNFGNVPWEGMAEEEGHTDIIENWLVNNTSSIGVPASVKKNLKKMQTSNLVPPVLQSNMVNKGSATNKSTKSTTKPKGKKP